MTNKFPQYDVKRVRRAREFLKNLDKHLDKGEVERQDYKTSDFYNPLVDSSNDSLKANALCVMDQIRAEEIANEYHQKKESIKSIGIEDPVLIIPMNDPSTHYKKKLVDGVTRVTALRDIEKENRVPPTIGAVPAYYVVCPKLADFVRTHKEEIQNVSNDPKPSDPNSKETAKKWIRNQIKQYRSHGGEPDKEFIKAFRPYVLEQYKNNRTEKTINKWISEVINEIKVDNSPVTSYRETTLRKEKKKTLLEKIDKKLIDPECTKRYELNLSTSSMMEKLIGVELIRQTKKDQKNIKSVLEIHSESHTSEKSLLSSTVALFDKIKAVEAVHDLKLFSEVFAMDQVGTDGMLNEKKVRERLKKLKEADQDFKQAKLTLVRSA